MTHPENEALKGPQKLRRPEAARSLILTLSFASANRGAEDHRALNMSLKVCKCVQCVCVCAQRGCSSAICRKN